MIYALILRPSSHFIHSSTGIFIYEGRTRTMKICSILHISGVSIPSNIYQLMREYL